MALKRLLAVYGMGLALAIFIQGAAQATTLDCSLPAGALPNPEVAPGTRNAEIPIQHILILMQENHSFDNYFGALNDPRFYGDEVDGIHPELFNLDLKGRKVHPHPETQACVADLKHDWDSMHRDWHDGKLDGFVRLNDAKGNGARTMGYYTDQQLPFYYALADQFAIGDRYFASALTQTFPNRFFSLAGTAFGHIRNDFPLPGKEFKQRNIFDVLSENGVSWKYYSDKPGYIALFQPTFLHNREHLGKIEDYERDLREGTLPEVAFLNSSFDGEDEHPDADIQIGQKWVADRVHALVQSSAWPTSVLFFTYDENGGFYDHVAPPRACAPDAILPELKADNEPGDYARYGFRVPFIAVSPYARHHYVSHRIYDHTSILKFIETKFNLPALTLRDANADPFSDVFDFENPIIGVKELPSGEPNPAWSCDREAPPETQAGIQ